MLRGFARNFKPLEILTGEEVEAIHTGTLDVLWETGVRVEHVKALKLFEEKGCRVDYGQMRVHFPSSLVEECLRKAPGSFRVKARDPENDLTIGSDTTYFVSNAGMGTVNLDTWESRIPTRKEYYDYITILDALDNVHLIGPYPWFGFEGVPPVMGVLEGVAAKIRHSTKFLAEANTNGADMFIIQMGKAIGAEIMGVVDGASPLTIFGDQVEAAFRGAEAGFPMILPSGSIHGGTGPATIAGSAVSNNVENIAALVLLQLIRPKTRVLARCTTFPQNMRTGSPAFGAIGCSLHHVVFNQIWRKYGIPTLNSGSLSSSKSIDFQDGYETGINILTAALSGANVIWLHGAIHGELTAHPVQAVLDDDIAGMIGRFLEGVNVDEETLAINLIEEVGPIPGFYLDKKHTRKWWKKEQFIPKTADRLTYSEWTKAGKKSCLDYANKRIKEILSTHSSTPLTASQNEAIEEILEEARQYYIKKGMV